MGYDPDKHHRHSIRLREWDYAQPGAYFVTIVAYGRELLFGQVVDGEIRLSEFGEIVSNEWLASAGIRREIQSHAFVVMNNHIHGIVWIFADDDIVGDRPVAPTATRAHTEIVGFVHRRIQIRRNQTHQ